MENLENYNMNTILSDFCHNTGASYKYDEDGDKIYERFIDTYGNVLETWYDYIMYNEEKHIGHVKKIGAIAYKYVNEESWYEYDGDEYVTCKTIDNAYGKYESVKYSKYDENGMLMHERTNITCYNTNEKISIDYWYGWDENKNVIYTKYRHSHKLFKYENYEEWYRYNECGERIKIFHHSKNEDYVECNNGIYCYKYNWRYLPN
jgi:hypothetical protein